MKSTMGFPNLSGAVIHGFLKGQRLKLKTKHIPVDTTIADEVTSDEEGPSSPPAVAGRLASMTSGGTLVSAITTVGATVTATSSLPTVETISNIDAKKARSEANNARSLARNLLIKQHLESQHDSVSKEGSKKRIFVEVKPGLQRSIKTEPGKYITVIYFVKIIAWVI